MLVDLRSDTVTKPSKGMLEAMINAEVGDDVFVEDFTVQQLEQELAEYFGMEAGIFCPSGTMTNQIAINLHMNPGEQVICDKFAHIYNYEGAGTALNSMCSTRTIDGKDGKITVEQIKANLTPDDIHYPPTTLVSLENTCNRAGGTYYTIEEIEEIADFTKGQNIPLHLDGARVFNALVKTGDDPKRYGKSFDSISICLSKGMGCPVGSVLIGSKEFIHKARRVRKRLGGGMRQIGYLGAAGLYALHNNVERMSDDHKHAQMIGDALQECDYVDHILPIETNIILFKLKDTVYAETFLAELSNKNIMGIYFDNHNVRFVTHLDVDVKMIEYVVNTLKSLEL